MPRPARPWFRFYVEALSDRKLRRLTPAQRWLWVAILGAARMSPKPGALVVADEPLSDDEVADIAGMTVKEVRKAMPLYERAGMLHREDDTWRVTNWDSRQFESDDTTERTRKHRSKERSNGVPGNAPETEAETDTPPLPPAQRGERRRPRIEPARSPQPPPIAELLAARPDPLPVEEGLAHVRALRQVGDV